MMHYSLPTAIAATAALWCSATASTSGGIGGIRSSRTTPPLAFQNLLPPNINLPSSISSFFLPPKNGGGGAAATGGGGCGDVDLEDRLLAAIESGRRSGGGAGTGRLDISDEVSDLVALLESSPRSAPRPAVAPQLYGRWRLLRTSNADTASPIQRRAVDATRFDIYQDIVVLDDDSGGAGGGGGAKKRLLVRQIVEFGKGGEDGGAANNNRLCVDALASTSAYPLEELTEREGTGRILGLNVLGVSMVGSDAAEDPDRPDSRVRFVFDEGRFEFGKFVLPYPVPFRNPLFRDAVKGWIDVTYLSDRVRISRGNKGTTFVLRKVE
jgi:hypothetical protein